MNKSIPWLTFSAIVVMVVLVAAVMTPAERGDRWFSGDHVRGSGNVVTEEREIESFTELEANGAFDVVITVGPEPSLKITFDDNLIDLVESRVRGRLLVLESRDSWSSREDCLVEITTPEFRLLDVNGSGDVEIFGLAGRSFECDIDGSGDVTVEGEVDELDVGIDGSGDFNSRELKAKEGHFTSRGSGDVEILAIEGRLFECSIGGSGDLVVEGEVEEVDLTIEGSGNIDARDLKARKAYVRIRGSGDVDVFASERFDGAIYGSGDIDYYGHPGLTDTHIAGSGSIRRR